MMKTLCACLQIVHGDLKSLNILLTRGWQLAKLGDVGVARYLKSKDVPDHVARESPATCLCTPAMIP
jgi:serine/threonine protein kinase